MEQLHHYLKTFESGARRLSQSGYQATVPHPYTIEICPHGHNDDRIICTIFGLIHGVEVAGSAVLCNLIDLLCQFRPKLRGRVALALGNPWAALAGVRYRERDLNRSFGTSGTETAEEERAKQLEFFLDRTDFLLDIHQTNELAVEPFFIFPFSRGGYAFARAINPQVPIVTRWGAAFSAIGSCSDEYINQQNGSGITIELGKCGFEPYQVGLGTSAAMRALYLSKAISSDEETAPFELPKQMWAPTLTWVDRVPYPNEGVVTTTPGLKNMARVEVGDVLAKTANSSITATHAGHILFPQYWNEQKGTPRPTELCHVVESIDESAFPEKP